MTKFLTKCVRPLILDGLDNQHKPDRHGMWAGQLKNGNLRYFHFWYRDDPWGNWSTYYSIDLVRDDGDSPWHAEVKFVHDVPGYEERIPTLSIPSDAQLLPNGVGVRFENVKFDGDTAQRIAEAMRELIREITPRVNDWGNENEDTEAGEVSRG